MLSHCLELPKESLSWAERPVETKITTSESFQLTVHVIRSSVLINLSRSHPCLPHSRSHWILPHIYFFLCKMKERRLTNYIDQINQTGLLIGWYSIVRIEICLQSRLPGEAQFREHSAKWKDDIVLEFVWNMHMHVCVFIQVKSNNSMSLSGRTMFQIKIFWF